MNQVSSYDVLLYMIVSVRNVVEHDMQSMLNDNINTHFLISRMPAAAAAAEEVE